MSILAITVYAGSEKLCLMTERMLESFWECVEESKLTESVRVAAVDNGANRRMRHDLAPWNPLLSKNEGFGVGVNAAIGSEIGDFTHVLVLNNDLEFPDKTWLGELLKEREGELVLSPCTDITATGIAIGRKAVDEGPRRADQVSAFCWLVPAPVIRKIKKKHGYWLFNPDFSNYGSDDVTGAILRGLVGPKPFKVVPRSFVKHLKGQTANELGIKPGQKDVLQRISNWKRAKGLR